MFCIFIRKITKNINLIVIIDRFIPLIIKYSSISEILLNCERALRIFVRPKCKSEIKKIAILFLQIQILQLQQLDLYHNLSCMKFPFFKNPKSVYNITPISEAVICIVPQPYFLASSTILDRSCLAMPFLR